MSSPDDATDRSRILYEKSEEHAAAREAAAIGGQAGDEELDPAQRPVIEGGGGVAEGFELAEDDLIASASHGDSRKNPLADRFSAEAEPDPATYGESDHPASSEVSGSDR